MDTLTTSLVGWTETLLTKRRAKIYRKKKKQVLKKRVLEGRILALLRFSEEEKEAYYKRRYSRQQGGRKSLQPLHWRYSPATVLIVFCEWIGAFLWAAMVVLVVNQFFIQGYQIPSGSMIETLLVGDRIFVSKVIYGPELLPGVGKVPGLTTPSRGDVVIFTNPEYESRGPLFDVVKTVIYMLTFAMVDIDADENGNPKPYLLVKRLVAQDGDVYRENQGDLEVKAPGEDSFLPEEEFKTLSQVRYQNRREVVKEDYPYFAAWGVDRAYRERRLGAPIAVGLELLKEPRSPYPDSREVNLWQSKTQFAMAPQNDFAASLWCRGKELGRYIPPGWALPLGDNRDNSNDGRFFGAIPKEKILGKAFIKYWTEGWIGIRLIR